MQLIMEVEQDLKVANVICRNGQRYIASSMHEVSRDLVVNSTSKKKQALLLEKGFVRKCCIFFIILLFFPTLAAAVPYGAAASFALPAKDKPQADKPPKMPEALRMTLIVLAAIVFFANITIFLCRTDPMYYGMPQFHMPKLQVSLAVMGIIASLVGGTIFSYFESSWKVLVITVYLSSPLMVISISNFPKRKTSSGPTTAFATIAEMENAIREAHEKTDNAIAVIRNRLTMTEQVKDLILSRERRTSDAVLLALIREQTAFLDRDAAITERDAAIAERDAALKEAKEAKEVMQRKKKSYVHSQVSS